jgi:hypothetical protein
MRAAMALPVPPEDPPAMREVVEDFVSRHL